MTQSNVGNPPAKPVRSTPNRDSPDNPENTYKRWRDDYLTQVDTDFAHFEKANEEARQHARNERPNRMDSKSPTVNPGKRADR